MASLYFTAMVECWFLEPQMKTKIASSKLSPHIFFNKLPRSFLLYQDPSEVILFVARRTSFGSGHQDRSSRSHRNEAAKDRDGWQLLLRAWPYALLTGAKRMSVWVSDQELRDIKRNWDFTGFMKTHITRMTFFFFFRTCEVRKKRYLSIIFALVFNWQLIISLWPCLFSILLHRRTKMIVCKALNKTHLFNPFAKENVRPGSVLL